MFLQPDLSLSGFTLYLTQSLQTLTKFVTKIKITYNKEKLTDHI